MQICNNSEHVICIMYSQYDEDSYVQYILQRIYPGDIHTFEPIDNEIEIW